MESFSSFNVKIIQMTITLSQSKSTKPPSKNIISNSTVEMPSFAFYIVHETLSLSMVLQIINFEKLGKLYRLYLTMIAFFTTALHVIFINHGGRMKIFCIQLHLPSTQFFFLASLVPWSVVVIRAPLQPLVSIGFLNSVLRKFASLSWYA